MEPGRQVEIQLGHMCNNRCVFCVSGQRTALGAGRPTDPALLLARIREARAAGHHKITLLGGEPTLQPAFMRVLEECAALGFDDVVIFTNGVKTARAAFVDALIGTGANLTWRLSIQGATRRSHERTTNKRGSFARVLRSLEHLRARDQRVTVNTCVVQTNYETVDRFADLLLPHGVVQLHVDLMRPLDAGRREERELRALMVSHTDLAAPLARMVHAFPPGFDVNIGNLPYCVAPELSPWIHHDGEHTQTIAIDGDDRLSRPWDKYRVKRRDKIKPRSCVACLLEPRCSGVFETYARFHGLDELVALTAERLRRVDPGRRLLCLHLRPLFSELEGWEVREQGLEEVHLRSRSDASLRVALRRGAAPGSVARWEGVSLHLLSAPRDRARAIGALRALGRRISAAGRRVIHPPGDDALGVPARSIERRLAHLRSAAPFCALQWRDLRLSEGGRRAELSLVGPAGESATFWLAEEGRRATGGYALCAGTVPTEALVSGLRAVLGALERGQRAAASS